MSQVVNAENGALQEIFLKPLPSSIFALNFTFLLFASNVSSSTHLGFPENPSNLESAFFASSGFCGDSTAAKSAAAQDWSFTAHIEPPLEKKYSPSPSLEERKAQNDGITISAVAIVSSSKPAKAEDSIAPKAVALPSEALIAPHLSLSGDTGALAETSANAIDTRSESEIPPTASNFLTKYAPEGANAILRAITYFNISYHTKFHKGQVKVFVAQKLRFLGHRAAH